MPHFVIISIDKETAADVRAKTRDEHLAYLAKHKDDIVFFGPFVTGDRQHMIGSMIVVDMLDVDSVMTFCKNDPYSKADLFAKTEVRSFKPIDPSTLGE